MSPAATRSEASTPASLAQPVDLKLEVLNVPVADLDRAKSFYGSLGWRLDADIAGEEFRVLQFTPPGSPTSVIFGKGITAAPYLVVSDIEAARADLAARGVDISEVYHYAGSEGRCSGPDPERRGNAWLLQEVTKRLPGRVEETFSSSADLAAALRRAAAAHGEHEKRNEGKYDDNWPDWYAEHMVAEHAGGLLPL
jgi:catechol 2,3-dioxygenase-like lactoylglutathione lyase family enzyme